MKITEKQIIGELVAKDYRTASVFKKLGIDFCCNGNRTIEDACIKKNRDSKEVIELLEAAMLGVDQETIDFQLWPADLLADYIERKHHRYVEEKTMEILPFLDKVCKVHGAHHPELLLIQEQFLSAAGELAQHMKKEELVLFPYIRRMVKAEQERIDLGKPHFGSVLNPVSMMKEEHSTEGERFHQIAALSNQYTPPPEACNTYRVTFSMLNEFEADLHQHIHLENNILFPMAIEMEKELLHLA